MKIIQTFWSAGYSNPIIENFGWKNSIYNLFSWTLSSHLIRRHYSKLVLYTDQAGKELLIDKLKLPYTDVHIQHDSLNNWSRNAWAVSKLYTYSLQSEPFLHVDGDVFIWEPFGEILQSDLIAQNLERGYLKAYNQLLETLAFLPDVFETTDKENGILMVNTGVFGGQDIDSIRAMTSQIFDTLGKNFSVISEIESVTFSLFFEQFMISQIAKKRSVDFQYVFPYLFSQSSYESFGDFEEIPQKPFLHLVSKFKYNSRALDLMHRQLRKEFPEAYLNVLKVSERSNIKGSKMVIPSTNLFQDSLQTKNSKFTDDHFIPNSSHKKIQFSINSILDYWQTDRIQEIAKNLTSCKILISPSFNWINLKDENLLERDLRSHDQYHLLKNLDAKIQLDQNLLVINSENHLLKEYFLENDGSLFHEFFIAVVPEINQKLHWVLIDELDYRLLILISKRLTLNELFCKFQRMFEQENDMDNDSAFWKLLRIRLKNFIYNRMIFMSAHGK